MWLLIKARKLWKAHLVPAATYDSAALGMAPSTVARLRPQAVVAARRSEGGTAFDRVDEQLEIWSQRLHESHTAG